MTGLVRMLASLIALALGAAACGSTGQVGVGRGQEPGFDVEFGGSGALAGDKAYAGEGLVADTDADPPARDVGPGTGGVSGERPPRGEPWSSPGGSPPSAAAAPDERLLIGLVAQSGNPGAMFGIDATREATEEDTEAFDALIDEINDRGGFAGRRIEVAVTFVDQTDQSEATQVRLQEAACLEMTEDRKVFMVFGDSYTTAQAQRCYAKHRTPLFSFTGGGDSQERLSVQPWVLPSLWLTLDRLARLTPPSLQRQGFLDAPIGVLAFDTPSYKRAVEDHLVPGLKRLGGDVREVVYMKASYEDIGAQVSSAVLRFRSTGIDRVIVFANGGGVWLIFAQQAEAQRYRPSYAISTLTRPWWTGDLVPAAQRERVVGTGFALHLDLHERAQPPVTPQEKACWDIFERRAGVKYERRDEAGIGALVGCESFLLAQAALRPAEGKSLRREDVPKLYWALDGDYDPIMFESLRFREGRMDAIDVYADFRWDTGECDCVTYTTPWLRVPFD